MLWFLALDNALINNDGYWTRASDYSLYRDPKGKFHVIPHDMNEAFGPAMSFGVVGARAGLRRAAAAGRAAARGPEAARAARGRAAAAGGRRTSIRWSAWTTTGSRCGAACWPCPP